MTYSDMYYRKFGQLQQRLDVLNVTLRLTIDLEDEESLFKRFSLLFVELYIYYLLAR